MNKIQHSDIIVAGGGLNGLAAALVGAHAGYQVRLFEPHSQKNMTHPKADGRASTLAATSFALLEALGMEDDLRAVAEPIWDIRVTQGEGLRGVSPFYLHFSAEALEAKHHLPNQPFGYVIENSHLRKIFYAYAQSHPAISLQYDEKITEFDLNPEGNPHQLTLMSDKGDYQAQLLLACDGRASAIQTQSGIDAMRWDYHQQAIITAIFHEYAHGGAAIEQFMASGPFALLPMTEQRSAVVWTEKNDRAQRIAALSDDEFLCLLQERVGDWLGEIALAAPRQVFPLHFSHALRYYQHRLLLLGDSAHAIHPLAGQGLNLGLRDSAALWDILDEAKKCGLDIGREETLHRYHALRQSDNHAVALMTDGLNRLFSMRNPVMHAARAMGLKSVNHITPLRDFFALRAMGIRHHSKLPKRMQLVSKK